MNVLLRPFLTIVLALLSTASAKGIYAPSEKKYRMQLGFFLVWHTVCAWNCC